VPLAEAYAACARLAAAHYENFPVASRLVPARMRPHIAAVYAFARTADDFADEDGLTLAERHALLDDWHARLLRAAPSSGPRPGQAQDVSGGFRLQAEERRQPDLPAEAGSHERLGTPKLHWPQTAVDRDLVFEALAHTIETCSLDVTLFEDLLSAFRQDTIVTRYATWEDVLDYCRRSANPVGRLVLRIAGYRDARLDAASDALCTALQLTNFWQDLAVDWRRGRLYVPAAERAAAGASEADLDAGRITPAWRAALARSAVRTRQLFQQGRPVCDGVHGRLRYELRLTWLGAMRVLDRLEAAGFDVFNERPTIVPADAPALVRKLLTWRRT
jgi:hydroxysqualene synthase